MLDSSWREHRSNPPLDEENLVADDGERDQSGERESKKANEIEKGGTRYVGAWPRSHRGYARFKKIKIKEFVTAYARPCAKFKQDLPAQQFSDTRADRTIRNSEPTHSRNPLW